MAGAPPNGSGPAIRLDGVSKRYGSATRGVLALDHVSLAVPKGSVFGLLGPNGAGKTTVIKLLTGISDFTDGNAWVAGYDVRRASMEVRARIGWVAAEVILDDDFSGWENLWLQARLQNLTVWEERARQLLGHFELLDRKDDRVGHYSTGMRKKLEIALALLHQPSVVFMDEPTIGLDVATRRMLWEIVAGVRAEFGVTVLLTTHYIEEADALCDRIAIIDHGRIIAEGTPTELKARVQADIVVLEVADGFDAAGLGHLPGVQKAGLQGAEWSFRVASSEAFLPQLFAAVPTDRIRRLSVEKPSLETVFLELTGRRIGQDEPMRDVRKFYVQMRRARQ